MNLAFIFLRSFVAGATVYAFTYTAVTAATGNLPHDLGIIISGAALSIAGVLLIARTSDA